MKIVKLLLIALLCMILVISVVMDIRWVDDDEDNILNLTRENCQIGNTITYGAYPQDNKLGKEPIQWQVLTISGDTVLLISKFILDAADYSTEWLKQEFYLKAFSDVERERLIPIPYCVNGKEMQDFVLYPSKEIISDYCNNSIDRKAELTDYAKKKTREDGKRKYWLLGEMCVDETGEIDEFCHIPSPGNGYGVRPIIAVQLNNSISSLFF